MAGSFKAAGGPGCGGRLRSGACAETTTLARRQRASRDGSHPVSATADGRVVSLLAFRHDAQFHAPIAWEKAFGGGANVGWRQRPITGEILVEPIWIAGLRRIGIQLIGLAAESPHPFHPVVERGLDLIQRALQF